MSSSRLVFWSTWLGNFFEHYDTALFGFLSAFLAPLIFPNADPLSALILTYAIIPLSMLARPVGALVFGAIGDYYGRKQALFLTLMGMAIVSLFIAFTPTYQQAGILAPLFFCIGRALQNFFCAGEIMGGAIYLLENSPKEKQDILSGFYSTSTVGGILLASVGVAFLSQGQSIIWSWRYLYVFGALTALSAFVIRRKLPQDKPSLQPIQLPFKKIWEHRKAFCFILLLSGLNYANFAISLVLMNGFIPLITNATQAEMMLLNALLLVFDLCMLPLFAWISSKITREKVMAIASFAIVLFGMPLMGLLPQASLATIIGVRLCLVTFGVAFSAPFHAWTQNLVPADCRYSVISLGYTLGSQIFGGPTAVLSLWTYQQTGSAESLAFYWILLSLLSGCFLVYNLTSHSKKKIYYYNLNKY